MRSLGSSPVWPLLMVLLSMATAASPAHAVREADSVMRRETFDWKAAQEADRVVALPGQAAGFLVQRR
jgi:hypothetical protein